MVVLFSFPGFLSILNALFLYLNWVIRYTKILLYIISSDSKKSLLIIPYWKPQQSVFSDPLFRAMESTLPQNESGEDTEVALQPLDYWNSELASFVKDAVRHDRRSLVLDKWRLLWYAEKWIWFTERLLFFRGIISYRVMGNIYYVQIPEKRYVHFAPTVRSVRLKRYKYDFISGFRQREKRGVPPAA